MRRSLTAAGLVALLATLVWACTDPPAAEPFAGLSLTILHTNDVHARFLELNRLGGRCRGSEAEDGACFGGVARRATAIRRTRAEVPNVLPQPTHHAPLLALAGLSRAQESRFPHHHGYLEADMGSVSSTWAT